jgi:hypothetical protein
MSLRLFGFVSSVLFTSLALADDFKTVNGKDGSECCAGFWLLECGWAERCLWPTCFLRSCTVSASNRPAQRVPDRLSAQLANKSGLLTRMGPIASNSWGLDL